MRKTFVQRTCVRCGALFEVSPPSSPKRNCSKSCGAKASKNFKHGHSDETRTYESWRKMRRRCTQTNFIDYPHYGGRGITICKRWDDFVNFLTDMGERPAGHSLD